jgi:putative spermidine/putrescine transport system permease protein/spermidine/putrescine transport system permease protein
MSAPSSGVVGLQATEAGSNAAALDRLERWERWRLLALSAPALGLVLIVVVVPTAWLFGLSFVDEQGQWSLKNYARLVASPSYFQIFRSTFEISAVVTLACVLIGYPLAYMLAELSRRTANICMIAVVVPFWTSLLVRTYAWLVLLQGKGLINQSLMALGIIAEPLRLVHNFTGTVIGMTHIMIPFLVLPLYTSMRAINRDYVKAAFSLGAGPTRAFWEVFLPLALPGLLAGVALVFVLCLGFFVTPVLLGGGTVVMISMRIQNSVNFYSNWGAASALGVVLLAVTLVILFVATKAAKQVWASQGQE